MALLSTKSDDNNNNNNNNEINTTSNNRGKYNKKELMAMSKEERAALIFNDMQKNISQDLDPNINLNINQTKLSEQARDARNYMSLPTSKQYHLEMVKRTFTKNAPYTDPDELQIQFADYFKLCYEFKKTPTIEGLCIYAGISLVGFQIHIKEPQSIFHEVCVKAKSLIHEFTQQAAIEGYISPQMYSLLAKNYWNFVTNSDNNVVVINNNDTSAKQKLDLLDALELSQKELDD